MGGSIVFRLTTHGALQQTAGGVGTHITQYVVSTRPQTKPHTDSQATAVQGCCTLELL